jgi:hypothetical protein
VWGVSELLVNAKPRNKIEDQHPKMKVVMARIEAVVAAERNFIV